jgi:hypothetical protein
MAEFLISKSYSLKISEWYPVKVYGGPHEWKRLTNYPCELDSKAWGNIIAIHES